MSFDSLQVSEREILDHSPNLRNPIIRPVIKEVDDIQAIVKQLRNRCGDITQITQAIMHNFTIDMDMLQAVLYEDQASGEVI